MEIRSRVAAGVLVGLVFGATGMAAASAAPVGFPVDVVAHTNLAGGTSEFEGNIPGCETGTVVDVENHTRFTPWGGVFVGVKEFTCAGDVGGFVVRLNARFGEFGSTGSWTIDEAWGAYEGIKGSGELTGTPTELGIDDRYTGSAR